MTNSRPAHFTNDPETAARDAVVSLAHQMISGDVGPDGPGDTFRSLAQRLYTDSTGSLVLHPREQVEELVHDGAADGQACDPKFAGRVITELDYADVRHVRPVTEIMLACRMMLVLTDDSQRELLEQDDELLQRFFSTPHIDANEQVQAFRPIFVGVVSSRREQIMALGPERARAHLNHLD